MGIRERLSQYILRTIYRRFMHSAPRIYNLVDDELKELQGTVVDLGGGPGLLVPLLFRKGAAYIIDVDIDFEMLRVHNYNFDKVVADASDLIFREESIEYVVIHDALHHFRNPVLTLRNYLGILRKCMFIVDIDANKRLGKFIAYLERVMGFPSKFFGIEDLVETLENIKPVCIRYTHRGSANFYMEVCVPKN